MTCPLCGQRKARRGCPALGKQICAVCCGTKRLVQIACPNDCAYLSTAREHPSAAAVRRQQHDLSSIMRAMRDLNERQSRLLLLMLSSLARYQPPELQPLIDEDVSEAAAALAATFETAARGVIYEHRPASLSAERLANTLKPVLAEAGRDLGTTFDRDAAVVLRRVEAAARDAGELAADRRRGFLDLVGRLISKQDQAPSEPEASEEGSRIIVP